MKIRTPLLILFVGVLGLMIGLQTRDATSSDPATDNLRKVEEAFGFINRNYVERVDSAQLSEDAIEGMVASAFDPVEAAVAEEFDVDPDAPHDGPCV